MTRLEPDARIVTFANGWVIREPIIACDHAAMRLVWSAESGVTTHYNASVQVLAEAGGDAKVVWIAGFLPDSVSATIDQAMSAGATAMTAALDRAAAPAAMAT